MKQQFSLKSLRSKRLQDACRAFNAGTLKRFRKDTCGGVMIYIGLALPVLRGFSGMAVDGSIWFANKRSMQASADAAAFSAALEMTRINDDSLAKSRAISDAEAHGIRRGFILRLRGVTKRTPKVVKSCLVKA